MYTGFNFKSYKSCFDSHFKELEGDIATWKDQSIWKGSSDEVKKVKRSKEEICGVSSQDILMLMPSEVSWPEAREACRRFGGRLHIDRSEESVGTRTFPLIAKGEREFPDRCVRVWLGASDVKEEGVWRDSETDEVIDISQFWVDGQPNGVRVQNCAGIWELVSSNKQDLKLNAMKMERRMGQGVKHTMTAAAIQRLNAMSAASLNTPRQLSEVFAKMRSQTCFTT